MKSNIGEIWILAKNIDRKSIPTDLQGQLNGSNRIRQSMKQLKHLGCIVWPQHSMGKLQKWFINETQRFESIKTFPIQGWN